MTLRMLCSKTDLPLLNRWSSAALDETTETPCLSVSSTIVLLTGNSCSRCRSPERMATEPLTEVGLMESDRHGSLVPARCHLIVPRHTSPISTEQSENTSVATTAPMTWMARLNRVFGIDLTVCPKCGGKLRVIGEVTDPKTIARILAHAKQREHHERGPRAPPVLLAS